MSTPEEARFLLECWEQKVCPQCLKQIPEGTPVGSGTKSEGRFCCLDCYGEYHKKKLVEKHKRLLEEKQQHHN